MAVKFEDYYKTLSVARDATADEIKRAYRKLAQKWHPDRNKDDGAADQFSKVNEAYEVLKDPDTRSQYDQYGQNYKAGQEFRPPPGFEGFGGGRGTGGGFGGGDFSEFFQQMFGGSGPRNGQPGGDPFGGFGGATSGGAPREQEAEITVSLHEAYHGGTRQITLTGGMAGDKKIDVKIPAGIKPGSKIRLKGENLLLKINVAPDPRFTVNGKDLTADLKISPALAALGGKADVATLDGTVTMNIPAGVASGSRLRLAGKGLGEGSGGGNLYVRVLINVPKTLSEDQRELYEKLRDLDPDHDST